MPIGFFCSLGSKLLNQVPLFLSLLDRKPPGHPFYFCFVFSSHFFLLFLPSFLSYSTEKTKNLGASFLLHSRPKLLRKLNRHLTTNVPAIVLGDASLMRWCFAQLVESDRVLANRLAGSGVSVGL